MSFLTEFGDLLIDAVSIERLEAGVKNPLNGAAELVKTSLWSGMGLLRPYQRNRAEGILTQNAGIALDIPAFELWIPLISLPDVPENTLRVTVNARVYPLLRPPFRNVSLDLDHYKLYLRAAL